MDIKREIIKRALDTSNAFFSGQAEATKVNPNIWDNRLREFEQELLVMTPQAEQFDFRSPGVDYKVTIDDTPSAAAALTETADISISAISTRNVTFTPTEYGAAYQLTRKEAVRSFFNAADRMVKKLGYSLALKKDNLAYATVKDGAGNAVIVNSKANASLVASTDTLDYESITSAITLIEEDKYIPADMFISYKQKENLLNISTINKANEFGTRDAIAKGLVGELFGLKIWVSHSVVKATTAGNNVDYAVVLGQSGTGERAFGYAIKRDPMIEKEYHARGRFWDIVAHEEYNFQVLHSGAICTICSYNSA